jgi:hypothetical protein
LALCVVGEREQDVVDVKAQVDGISAVVPVHQALAGVNGLKAIVDEKRPKSVSPGSWSRRQSVEVLAKFPDNARSSTHTRGRTNVDVLVRREVVGLQKSLRYVDRVYRPVLLGSVREKSTHLGCGRCTRVSVRRRGFGVLQVTPHTETSLSACKMLVLEDELGRDRLHIGWKSRLEDFIPCVASSEAVHLLVDGSFPEMPGRVGLGLFEGARLETHGTASVCGQNDNHRGSLTRRGSGPRRDSCGNDFDTKARREGMVCHGRPCR